MAGVNSSRKHAEGRVNLFNGEIIAKSVKCTNAVGQSFCPMSGHKIGLYKKTKSGNIELGD